MDRTKGIGPAFRKAARRVSMGAGTVAAIWLLAVAWTSVVSLSQSPEPSAPAVRSGAMPGEPPVVAPASAAEGRGWGSEALNAVRDRAFALAPVSIANACGLGASSCFKCHNGSRAEAPKMDEKSSPWHTDHMTVNDDCVGCHGGNPRIIKKDLAHTHLEKDPRAKVEMCVKCHKSGDAPTLLKRYQIASGGGK